MFYRVTNTVKKILINEIKEVIKDHPDFYDVDVRNKFKGLERDKKSIIVMNASASKMKLSINNFLGTIESFSTLANLKEKRGNALEWIRDDLKNIKSLVPAGFYILHMDTDKSFIIEQYISFSELLFPEYEGPNKTSHLKYKNVNPNSELITDNRGLKLLRNQHYTIDNENGVVTFLIEPTDYDGLNIKYKYIGKTKGPYSITEYELNNEAIPGVILAFGDRLREGDVQLIEVSEKREDTAKAYGGAWSLSFDFNILTQDSDALERLSDFVADSIWTLEEKFVDMGMPILDISLSGESEEQELDVPDEYNFQSSLSITMQVEWEVHRPIMGRIEQIYINQFNSTDSASFSDAQSAKLNNSLIGESDPKFFKSNRPNTGRGYDNTVGSNHFIGVTPMVNPTANVVRPNNFGSI